LLRLDESQDFACSVGCSSSTKKQSFFVDNALSVSKAASSPKRESLMKEGLWGI